MKEVEGGSVYGAALVPAGAVSGDEEEIEEV